MTKQVKGDLKHSGLFPRASLRSCIKKPTLSCTPHLHTPLLLLGAAWEAWETWYVNGQPFLFAFSGAPTSSSVDTCLAPLRLP